MSKLIFTSTSFYWQLYNRVSSVTYVRNMQGSDSISLSTTNNLPEVYTGPAPIIIRGAGNVTVFGLTNYFSTEFPNVLHSRVAPEEYKETISHINCVLRKIEPAIVKLLICGCFCCCCTLGFSMMPTVCITRRTRLMLEKVVEWENNRLYHKLGLHWRLSREKSENSTMVEYVLILEYLPKVSIYQPDWQLTW